jgi:exopolysaccharide biosynthesis polyprenyl glycosylphosphotransferase
MIKEHSISRLFLGLFALNNALILIFVKITLRQITGKMQEHGYNIIQALVIGSEYPAKRLIRNLQEQPELGYRVVGCLDPDSSRVGQMVRNVEVLGTTDQLEKILENLSIDEVFVAMPFEKLKDMKKMMYLCEQIGVRFSLSADWLKPHIAKTVVRNFLDFPVITYTATPTSIGQLLVKAVLDRILAAIALVFLVPLFLIIAIAIKLSGPGPVMFRQSRAGLNGRLFDMLKFRTMVENAEKMQEELADRNEMDGPVFKIRNDPRVTRIGRFLRKSSMDELPQFINVLKGEMSLVGPRPPIPEEVSRYERWQRRRLSMKPGITCFWQISGRNQVKFEEWMEMDLKYIDNWSLKLDFIILFKTIPVIFSGRGAS